MSFELKYFRKIEEAQAGTADRSSPDTEFDINDLGTSGPLIRRRAWLFLFRILRAVWPNPRFGRLLVVTRKKDVEEVLGDSETYVTPFGPEMKELAGGAEFVLGVEGPEHRDLKDMIGRVMLSADATRLKETATRWATGLIAGSGGRIDAVHDLFTRVAAETCNEYLGLDVPDTDAFADWTIAMNALLFADWFGSADTRRLALAGAARARAVIDRAIERTRAKPRPGRHAVLDRLLALQKEKDGPSDSTIRAALMGLATGFIPTTTLAAGNILDELLRRPGAMQKAEDAAKANDPIALQKILLEAARLNPTLSPGQLRFAAREGRIADGTWRRRKVPAGTVMLVATMSALRDYRAFPSPNTFDADRTQAPSLLFGSGPHRCLGEFVADALLTSTFGVLLQQKDLQRASGRAGKLAFVGCYPRRLDMEFEPASSPRRQSMVMVCAPLRADTDLVALKGQVCALGNPARRDMAAALEQTGVVHFASMSVAELGEEGGAAPHLLLELNVDGGRDAALAKIAHAAERWLEPIFRTVEGASLVDRLRSNAVELHARPRGAIGLNFNGTGEFSIADIEMQQTLAAVARKKLDRLQRSKASRLLGPMQTLDFVRRQIRRDPRFAGFLMRPSRRRLRFADWTERSLTDGAWALATSPTSRRAVSVLGALTLTVGVVIYLGLVWLYGAAVGISLPIHALRGFFGGIAVTAVLLGRALSLRGSSRRRVQSRGGENRRRAAGSRRPLLQKRHWPAACLIVLIFFVASYYEIAYSAGTDIRFIGYMLLAIVSGPLATAVFVGIPVIAFLLRLRYLELKDRPDDRTPNLTDMELIAASENHPSFAQNHITAIASLKSGPFRKLTLALGLWGIGLAVKYWYRPGFVVTMGTIHYAKWFRPPGTGKLVFLANYDGSWESYLEDFITKAHWGMSAAWSNAVGFPATRWLIEDGARDGDRFKRWVRRQQVVTQFWYSRFPHLTTDQIRTNALIHDGLMRAADDTAARAWLDCFGSMTLPSGSIEVDEVQSLVFRGLKTLPYAALAVLRLPESPSERTRWLQHAMAQVSFGDQPMSGNPKSDHGATFVAFSATGLGKLSVPEDGIGTFPAAFNIGMAGRSRVLGDAGASEAARWRWADGGRPDAAEAVLLVFAKSPQSRQDMLAQHAALLGQTAMLRVIYTEPPPGGIDYEHFGFRDGISQPTIRGTQRSTKGTLARDIVEPGEFIFGYPNNEGYFPASPAVPWESDPNNRLPVEAAAFPSRYPQFSRIQGWQTRDLGRNGTFIAVRQLEQDVKAFDAFTARQAAALLARHPELPRLVGRPVDARWVAAKMMGRWHDGTPLIHSPCNPTLRRDLNNDFDFGTEDPQGLQCPFGAHIRRANPRTSLEPGDPSQQVLTNRHRIIRRGRSYQEGDERGLLFIALCADLDRQFEFVQQSWIASPNFHGLRNEPDPVVTPKTVGASSPGSVFTIPTASVSLVLEDMRSFVTVRGGGYFFLPSRSAMRYLIDLSASRA